MQFTPITLKTLKPKETDFEPQALGQHLRKRRLELELTQKEAADHLGVNPWTVLNWETGRFNPPVREMPTILTFLGYYPFPNPTTVGEQLLRKRRERGWSIRKAAETLGVDPGTWRDWAAGEMVLYRTHRCLVAQLLGLDSSVLFDLMRARWNGKYRRWERTY